MKRLGALIITLSVLEACAASTPRTQDRQTALRTLLEADRALAVGVQTASVAALQSVLSDDAVLLLDGVPLLKGRAAIEQHTRSSSVALPARWTIVHSDVSLDGTLGYVLAWTEHSRARFGKSLGVWQHDGNRWRLAAWTETTAAGPLPDPRPVFPAPPAAKPRRDAPAKLAESVLEADLAFSQLSVLEGFGGALAAYAAPHGVLMPNGRGFVIGTDQIAAHAARIPKDTVIEWRPLITTAAESGDLAYTAGTSVFKATAPNGSERRVDGKYITVWMSLEGGWRFVADGGNSSPPQKR